MRVTHTSRVEVTVSEIEEAIREYLLARGFEVKSIEFDLYAQVGEAMINGAVANSVALSTQAPSK